MKHDSKIKSAANDDIKSQEKEIERWKATITPQTEYLCETMDKMDFSSAISAASSVVNQLGKYADNRTTYAAYTAIKDIEFDENIIPYRINITLNMEYINAQPFVEKYKKNVIYSIQMLVNSYVSNSVQFRVRERERGVKAYLKYINNAIDIASQIIRKGYYNGDKHFKAKIKKDDQLELILDGNITAKEITSIINKIKKEQKNIINYNNKTPKTETTKNKNLH